MNLNRKQLDRIAKAVKRVENLPPRELVSESSLLPHNPPFWANIVSYDSGTDRYSWAKQKYNSVGYLDDDAPTGDKNAYEVNGVAYIGKGTNVLLFFAGYDGSGNPLYAFLVPNPYSLFAVKVTQTGGSGGDDATACSFTYTVKDLNLNTIGTAMTPKKRRTAVGAYVAGGANTIGSAYVDETGALQLFDANEVPDVGTCPEGFI